eukprot:4300-Heterococcus_DN1.PRE.1
MMTAAGFVALMLTAVALSVYSCASSCSAVQHASDALYRLLHTNCNCICNCDVFEQPRWGVTANLCVKRLHPLVLFSQSCWAKSGGGEDIDYCLRCHTTSAATEKTCCSAVYVDALKLLLEAAAATATTTTTNASTTAAADGSTPHFVSVPTAVAQHPWWSGGQRQYVHFFNWAQGDGHLWDHYPQLTYWAFPNIAETMLLLCITVSASDLLCVHAVISDMGRDAACNGAVRGRALVLRVVLLAARHSAACMQFLLRCMHSMFTL